MPFYDKIMTDFGFVGEDYNHRGSDRSHRYMKHKKLTMYVATSDKYKRAIAFKPYLEKISISYDVTVEQTRFPTTADKALDPINSTINYSVSLKVPSHDINEARSNKRKIELFRSFINPTVTSAHPGYGIVRHLFFLSNVIQNGKLTTATDLSFLNNKNFKTEVATYKALYNVACQGFFQDINYSVVTEDGFYEYDGYNYPKTYNLELNFVAFNAQKDYGIFNFSYLTDGYEDNTGAVNLPVNNWPFGINVTGSRKSNVEVDNFSKKFLYKDVDNGEFSSLYSTNKKNFIFFSPHSPNAQFYKFNNDNLVYLKFKPFLKTLSFSRKINDELDKYNTHEYSQSQGFFPEAAEFDFSFDVISHSVSESIANHAKLQEIIKMISPRIGSEKGDFMTKKENRFIRILFSNMLYDETRYKDSEDPLKKNGFKDLNKITFGFDKRKSGKKVNDASTAGRPFYITKVSYEPDMSLGFFEYENMIFAKSFSINLKLTERYTPSQRKKVYDKIRRKK